MNADKKDQEARSRAFERCSGILDRLRVECPWDRKQTNESLRTNTIEEVYELSDALLRDDVEDIKKELGDVLLHVLFYAKIAEEKGLFDIADVCDALSDKLIYRHPHIFGDAKADSAEQVSQNWEQLKLKEKNRRHGVLSGVPESLPSMIKAYRIQDKASNVGFDWERPADAWDKVKEEAGELAREFESEDKKAREEELGDLMFSLINVARLYKINPDNALESCNRKFIKRFNFIESSLEQQGKNIAEASMEEKEELWEVSKKRG